MNKKLYLLTGISAIALSFSTVAMAADQPSNQDLLDRIQRLENELQRTQRQDAKNTNDLDDLKAAKPSTGWWNDTVISGRMYYNISDIDHKSNGVDQSDGGVGFNIKRLYLGIDHNFDTMFSANVTTDFAYDSGPIAATQIYIKKAYLQAKLDNALIIRLGATDLPWIPFVEGIYGYRQYEQTLTDRTKFGTSSDWGVHATGKFANGIIEYAVAVVDGSGYKHPVITNAVDVEGRVSATYEGFTAALGGYQGKLGKDIQGTPTFHTASRENALLAYVGNGIRVGGEVFQATDWGNVGTAAYDKAAGYSTWASYEFMPQWSVLGKYEHTKPNRTTKPTLKDDYYNVGISYAPAKIVDFALMYKREKAVNGTISTGNGTIGGSADGTYDEIGLFGQLRF